MAVYRLVGVESALLEQCPVEGYRVLRTIPELGYVDIEFVSESALEEHRNRFEQWCHSQHVDVGSLLFKRDQVALLAMDMDSTLITIECIDEIADFIGKKDQVSRITEASMQGQLDFSEALMQRVALLAGLPESTLDAVYTQRLQLSPGAKEMIDAFRKAGSYTLLVSGGFTFFTQRLKDLLDLDETHANRLEISDGCLTGRILGHVLDGTAKARHVKRVRQQVVSPLHNQKVIAVGDGSNDRWMFAEADAGIAYHAKPILEAVATHSIRYGGLDTLLAFFE